MASPQAPGATYSRQNGVMARHRLASHNSGPSCERPPLGAFLGSLLWLKLAPDGLKKVSRWPQVACPKKLQRACLFSCFVPQNTGSAELSCFIAKTRSSALPIFCGISYTVALSLMATTSEPPSAFLGLSLAFSALTPTRRVK